MSGEGEHKQDNNDANLEDCSNGEKREQGFGGWQARGRAHSPPATEHWKLREQGKENRGWLYGEKHARGDDPVDVAAKSRHQQPTASHPCQ
jgi:hypothetical protein